MVKIKEIVRKHHTTKGGMAGEGHGDLREQIKGGTIEEKKSKRKKAF